MNYYFNYDVSDEVLFGGNDIYTKLSAKDVKKILADMKKNKQQFRDLITNFEKMTPAEKLTVICKYYSFDETEFRKCEAEDELKNINASYKRIPVDLYYTTNQLNYIKAKELLVYASDKIKFKNKPLSSKKIWKLIDKKLLKVIDAIQEDDYLYSKAVVDTTKGDKIFVKPLLHPEGRATFNDLWLMAQTTKRHFTYDLINILKSEKLKEELLSDYNAIYVPMYKDALSRLAKQVEISKNVEQKEVEAMREAYISKRDKNARIVKQLDEVSKDIVDQSKGR